MNYNDKVARHIQAWETYKTALSNIKVLDPACGSGAFLNEVFDYLYKEGQNINDQLTELNAGQAHLSRWDTHILSNNLYGVDINHESIEITKLSLWLKTANRQEKLTYLEDNIKCGNSLIDDPAIAGEKAFDWHKEFPDIMQKGGFDVVVGNPPYVFAREKITQEEKDFYVKKYTSAQYQVNTYLLFIEKSIELIKSKVGKLSLIVPNAWLMVSSASNLRRLLLEKTTINSIVNLLGYSFENVNVETIILNITNTTPIKNHLISILKNNQYHDFYFLHTKSQQLFLQKMDFAFQIFIMDRDEFLIEKIRNKSRKLDDVYAVKCGLKAYQSGKGNPKQTKIDVQDRIYDRNYKEDEMTFKYLDGKDINRYLLSWGGTYLKYGKHLAEPRKLSLFSNSVLVIREITSNPPRCILATYFDSSETYLFNLSNIAVIQRDLEYDLRYPLVILNSTLMSYYFMRTTPKSVRKMFPKIILKDLRDFPIKTCDNQTPYIKIADKMLSLNSDLLAVKLQFSNLLKSEFLLEKISKNLENWFGLEFSDFIKELKKQKIKLSLVQKAEWMEYFNEQKAKALALKAEIDKTDKEIDQMVYELYGLTEEEIALVENS